MGIRVNASEAATLVGHTERTVREWIRTGKLRAEPTGPRSKVPGASGPSAWSIDVDELAALPGVSINRERYAEIESGRSRSPGGILARLEALEQTVATLRLRVRTLESSESAPRGVTTSPAYSLQSAPPTSDYLTQAHPSDLALNALLVQQDGLPGSIRGQARWVEQHGGPKASYVRDWSECGTWRTIEDVVAAVHRRRGWESWTPAGMAEPGRPTE